MRIIARHATSRFMAITSASMSSISCCTKALPLRAAPWPGTSVTQLMEKVSDAGMSRDSQLPSPTRGGDNRCMPKDSQLDDQSSAAQTPPGGPFLAGAMVIVTLGNPRDKFWGMILALAAEGLSMSSIELASFEDLVVMVKDGESFTPAVVFFPMHRIERLELDLPDGSLPSLSQRFLAKTGLDPAALLSSFEAGGTDRRTGAPCAEVHSTKDTT
jgi:hypothetical protein